MGQLALKQQQTLGSSGGGTVERLDASSWWINRPGLDFNDPDIRRKAGIFLERAQRMEEYLRRVFGLRNDNEIQGGSGEGLAYALADDAADDEGLPMWFRPLELLLELVVLRRRFEGFNPQESIEGGGDYRSQVLMFNQDGQFERGMRLGRPA